MRDLGLLVFDSWEWIGRLILDEFAELSLANANWRTRALTDFLYATHMDFYSTFLYFNLFFLFPFS